MNITHTNILYVTRDIKQGIFLKDYIYNQIMNLL